MNNLYRKSDVHRKIQLGGLIKKAGLDNEPTAVLYGLLLNAKENLEQHREEWWIKGEQGFKNQSGR